MLGQRRRRWPNIVPTLVECIVFSGIAIVMAANKDIRLYVFLLKQDSMAGRSILLESWAEAVLSKTRGRLSTIHLTYLDLVDWTAKSPAPATLCPPDLQHNSHMLAAP